MEFSVSFIFGVIAMLTGIVGTPLGSFIGTKLRKRYPRADPIVCGLALIFSTPLWMVTLFIANVDTTACFIVAAFALLLMNFTWAITTDILLVIYIHQIHSIFKEL